MSKELSRNIIPGLFLLVILMGAGSVTSLVIYSASPYTTGYQGARLLYAGINYENKEYTNQMRHEASRVRFDTTLSFDPDSSDTGMCNLIGEMTSAFIPSESLKNFASWVPNEWVREASYIENPRNIYNWQIENKTYIMEEWILRWYFSVSAEWDEGPYFMVRYDREWHDKIYSNTEIWFEVDLTPVWYFEEADRAYFAIAKMQLADVRFNAKRWDGKEDIPDPSVSVKPESQGSILPIYYGQFAKASTADKTVSSYQGKTLNPDLFTSKVYTYFTLEHFGTHQWDELTPFPTARYKGDVVTVAVDVTIFVIGEWTAKDIQSITQVEGDEGYGRVTKIGGAGFSLGDWFALPEARLLTVLALGAFFLLMLAIFAPWVLIAIMGIFGGKRRRR